jgi:hypothetical protein
MHYPIPDTMNPATKLNRAPDTTSMKAAHQASRGQIEQEIVEAIEEGRAGFRGGFVSSVALDYLLAELGKVRLITRDRRREIMGELGYIPHPQLPDGRVIMPFSDGTRPRLWVQPGHATEQRTAAEVTKIFQEAQTIR